ncbi:hypothetical protein L6164_033823 [Bauhinia variegata]|uniref:Uncharacterized protein n=1 Tax=Bauhinia variegata TaxID=167791 RepID=A0ACB9KSX3_BAUVA|nr:hypothetical protein L6164_033823 [Bauhinia variegata]
MQQAREEDAAELPLAQLICCKRKKKSRASSEGKDQGTSSNNASTVEEDSTTAKLGNDHRVRMSLFDPSVENFFKAIDKIAKLCGEEEFHNFEQSEIQRLSSLVTFLREWNDFNYEPRNVSFVRELGSPEGNDVISGINLPQFSSATVPKERQSEHDLSLEPRDFVMHVGGPVWALDWCPRIHGKPDCSVKCEFIAVAAHPPGATYHKMGAALTGRGLVQIWCLLNISGNDEEVPAPTEKRKGRPKRDGTTNEQSMQTKRARGRPRKNPTVLVDNMNCENSQPQALAVEYPNELLEKDEEVSPPTVKRKRGRPVKNTATSDKSSQTKKPIERPGKDSKEVAMADVSNPMPKSPVQMSGLKTKPPKLKFSHDRSPLLLTQGEDETLEDTYSIPEDVTLPRLVLCLAHNGKVAWDVKWRPANMSDPVCKQRMGYLAVLLGSGSLEVWEVPLPRAVRAIYINEGATDPRFVKLQPVFKCSMLKRGSLQSIPLTVEWSVSPPHDILLAGCHDGTVALWKFSSNTSSIFNDVKPLLCFGGDTVPIRAVSWAPFEGDPESSNIILTAGHGGLKFWDLRDPFRPLWELHPGSRIIYSVDWLSNPSCIIMSFEDGTMRTLSMVKAANDLPVTGEKFSGTKQQGLHCSPYSLFAIWNVQVSRKTGMVAYCGADGTVFRFQLTTKELETNHSRNRVPRFLCGSITEEESILTINTPLPNTSLSRKSFDKSRHAQSFKDLLNKSNPSKCAIDQMAKGSNPYSQTLALCDFADMGLESESEEPSGSAKKLKKPKKSRSNSKKPIDSLALVCRDDEMTSALGSDDEKIDLESTTGTNFPPKTVALHRLRWNMNKGSERWLCYGGAAGLVRCQMIVFSDMDKKWARKR